MGRLIILIVLVTIICVTYPLQRIDDIAPAGCNVVFHMPYEMHLPNCKTIKGGLGYDIIVPYQYLSDYRPLLKDSLGETMYIDNSNEKVADDYLNNLEARIIMVQELDDKILVYAYSRHLRDCVVIDSNKINIQLVITKDWIIIGTPLIIGGY